jgi:protein-L-isoaspartate(D-aspartate) O-methyltransferase
MPRTEADLVNAAVAAGVRDQRVLAALRRIPRARFVPESASERAYVDEPVPIPHGQVTTQPSLVARMVEALDLSGTEHVLEVGSGYGFQTALLAELSAFVWSVERFADVAETARANLAEQSVENAEVIVGDGSEGLAEHAPFHAILVSAAYPSVPPPLAEQLDEGGRLVQPIGHGGAEEVMLFERRGGVLVTVRGVSGARFVPLVGRYGFRAGGAPE